MREWITRLGVFGGLLALALVGAQVVSGWLAADAISLTSFTDGMDGVAIMARLNNNIAELEDKVNGKLAKGNFYANPSLANRLIYRQLHLQNCDPGGTDGCLVPADFDSESEFLTASTTSGFVSGWGPLRISEQTPVADSTVQVSAGAYRIRGKTYLYTGGDSPPIASPGNKVQAVLALDPNGDFADGVGGVGWIYGREESSPAEPVVPPGVAPILLVECASGASVINLNTTGTNCFIKREYRAIPSDWFAQPIDYQERWYDGFSYGDQDLGANDLQNWWKDGSLANCDLSAAEGVLLCSGSGAGHNTRLVGRSGNETNTPYIGFRLDRGETWVYEFRIKAATLPGTSWMFGISVGSDAAPTAVADYIGIVPGTAPASQFKCENKSSTGAATTTSTTDKTWDATEWNVFRFLMSAASVKYYLNGFLVCSHSTPGAIPDDIYMTPHFVGLSSVVDDWRLDYVASAVDTPHWTP